jgi:probable phosphoglycerate mutase
VIRGRRKKHERKQRRPARRPLPQSTPRGHITATIDGAARGNPGPAAYGVVFEAARPAAGGASGKVIARLNGRLGATTNNVAEYRALLAALTYAREQGWRALRVRTDSELLARQIQGDYKVKSPDLKPLHADASHLIAAFDSFAIESVPRSLTRAADRLANAALDGRSVPSVGGREKEKSGRGAAFIPTQEGHPHTIRAIYQNGVLKPLQPLDLPNGERVTVVIERRAKPEDS